MNFNYVFRKYHYDISKYFFKWISIASITVRNNSFGTRNITICKTLNLKENLKERHGMKTDIYHDLLKESSQINLRTGKNTLEIFYIIIHHYSQFPSLLYVTFLSTSASRAFRVPILGAKRMSFIPKRKILGVLM